MSDTPEQEGLPPSLQFLKWLVIVLTITMIGGVITVVSLIVTRMPQAFTNTATQMPKNLMLPVETKVEAITFGKTWTAVVTQDDRILIFDKAGQLSQEIEVETKP